MSIVICPKCGAKNRIDERKATVTKPVCGRCHADLSGVEVQPESSAPGPVIVTDSTFERDVLQVRGKPVLVDFWAQWCGPCRMLASALEQLASESSGEYVIAKLNVDENPRMAERYHISSIPAMLIFRDGQQVDQLVGLAPKQNIAAALSRAAAAGARS